MVLIGPPGSGKTMLARRLPIFLPPMNFDEAIETTKIHPVAGLLTAPALVHSVPQTNSWRYKLCGGLLFPMHHLQVRLVSSLVFDDKRIEGRLEVLAS